MENISKILSSSSSERRMPYCQQYSIISYKVILLRHIHHVTGGVFNFNLAPTKNAITSTERGPKAKKSDI